MSFKVTKHYGKFAIVKDDFWEKWYIVDVENSQTVYGNYYLKALKMDAEALESGAKSIEDFSNQWNHDYLNPIDMPKSLKAKQAQMQKQAVSGQQGISIPSTSETVKKGDGFVIAKDKNGFIEAYTDAGKHFSGFFDVTEAEQWAKTFGGASGISKPIGSKVPSIVSVTDKGAYKIVELDNGKYGYLIPSTGQSKVNLANKQYTIQTAKKAARKKAAELLQKQGVDPGSNAVDTLIDLYEGRVREMYGQAYREMAAKQAQYLEKHMARQAEMVAKHEAGEITARQLQEWRSSQSLIIARNAQMVNVLAEDLASADKRAMAMLNGYMMPAYAENFNYSTFQIEQQAKASTSFSLYNQHTVGEFLKDQNIQLLPEHDDDEDLNWCRQKIASATAQSVLQGESIPHAAARLQSVVVMSANSAVRAARTALTGAQNLGRLDAGKRAKEMGIELKKQWVATVDARTRHSHRQLDRETVEVEEEFSNGCMYPGDPTAEGSEVWNCRCAMRYVLPGHEYDDLPAFTKEGEEYERWKNAKMLDEEAQKAKIQSQIETIDAQKADILKALPPDETYEAQTALKQEAKLSEWDKKQHAIADSKAYYQKKLDEAMEGVAVSISDADVMYWDGKVAHYEAKLDALLDYDKKGKAYHDAKTAVQGQIDALDKQKKELGAKLAEFNKGAGPYSQERLAAGRRFATDREADKALRHISGKAWQEATKAERRAINTYTGGAYTDYNTPLGGFKGSYRNFIGMDQVDIDDMGRGREIRDMTTMIERSITEEDMWLRRGVGKRAMSGFFGFDPTMDITTLTDNELQGLVGMSNRMGAFQSCGTTFDTGFTQKPVTLEIFVPKGSEAMYVEPISKCGGGDGLSWDGVSSQSYLGSELETIIQRGGSYTCSGARRERGKLVFTLELHPEDGYWKFQQ